MGSHAKGAINACKPLSLNSNSSNACLPGSLACQRYKSDGEVFVAVMANNLASALYAGTAMAGRLVRARRKRRRILMATSHAP